MECPKNRYRIKIVSTGTVKQYTAQYRIWFLWFNIGNATTDKDKAWWRISRHYAQRIKKKRVRYQYINYSEI